MALDLLSHLIFTSSYSMLVEFPMQHRLVPKVLINLKYNRGVIVYDHPVPRSRSDII